MKCSNCPAYSERIGRHPACAAFKCFIRDNTPFPLCQYNKLWRRKETLGEFSQGKVYLQVRLKSAIERVRSKLQVPQPKLCDMYCAAELRVWCHLCGSSWPIEAPELACCCPNKTIGALPLYRLSRDGVFLLEVN